MTTTAKKPVNGSTAEARLRSAMRAHSKRSKKALVEQPECAALSADLPEVRLLDDDALDRFRPATSDLVRRYVSRKLPGGLTDLDVLAAYWERRVNGYAQNVGLVGDTQSGKTMLVEVMAHVLAGRLGLEKPLPVFTLSGSSAITDHDLFGQYRPVVEEGEERLVWMEGIVALACRVGGILYLDEINALPGNVTAALHPVLDDRRQFVNVRHPVSNGNGGYVPEVVPVSSLLWCVCTYNPGYAGMSKTNEAFANRFQWLDWGYDANVEKKLVKMAGVRVLALALRNARSVRAITTPIGTSALQRLEADLHAFGIEYALWAFLGQFNSDSERAKVEAIINERGIDSMLLADLGSAEEVV